MTRKIRSLYGEFKRKFSRAPARRSYSPQDEAAKLRRRVAELERRNAQLAEEALNQAGYINFLTGKCITFEIARLVGQVEKGAVLR